MQLDFMQGSTQFLPLYSLQYHFSEDIFHTPLGVRRGRVGGRRASSSHSGFTALFQILSLDHHIFRWETCRSKWDSRAWAEPTPALGTFSACTCDNLGRRGSRFLPWRLQLTFSPAAICFLTEVAPHCLYIL